MNDDLKTVTLLSALLVALCVLAVPASDGAQTDINIGMGSGDGVSVLYSDVPDTAEGRLIVTLTDLSMDDSYFMEIDGLRTAPLLRADIDGNRVMLKSSALKLAPGANHSLKVYDDSGYFAAASFTVGPSASSVELSSATETVAVGEEISLSAAVSPAGALYDKMVWSSDNGDVAAVTDGRVTAVSAGTAVISVTVTDPLGGERIAKCTVKVVNPVETVSLDVTELTLRAGATSVLKATVSPADAVFGGLVWDSSAPDVASVDNGTVTAHKAGTAVIKVIADTASATCTVEVRNPVDSVELNMSEFGLNVGGTFVLKASVTPADAVFGGLVWESSAPDVASVDNGTVTAHKAGTAVIRVTADTASATCKVIVSEPGINIGFGSGKDLEVAYMDVPEKGMGLLLLRYDDLSMASQYFMEIDGIKSAPLLKSDIDGNMARLLSENLKLQPGVHSVKVFDDAGYLKTATLNVGPSIVSIAVDPESAEVVIGQSMTLVPSVTPVNALHSGFAWSSDDESVASVDASGKITAHSTGTARITVSAGDVFTGKRIAVCTVTVVIQPVPVESVELNRSEATAEAGESFLLEATVTPADAEYDRLVWESSAPDVASVDNGTVTAHKAGTAVIKVTAGDRSAECTVTVTESVAEVTLTFMDRGTEYFSVTGIPGSAYVMPKDPTRVGYDFEGWEPAANGVMPDADQTVEAVWEVKKETNDEFDNEDESKTVVTEKTESKDGTDVRVGTVTTESKDGTVVSTTVITDDGTSKTAEQTITVDASNGVSEETIDAAIRQTQLGLANLEYQPDSVTTVVELNAPGNEDVEISASAVKKISDSDLAINTKNGTVVLDSDVCSTVGNRNGQMNLSVVSDAGGLTQAQKDAIGSNRFVDVNLTVGTDKVSELGGTARITLEFSKEQDKSVKVFHVDDRGVKTEVPCSYSDGKVTFSTEHFSVYVVEQVSGSEPVVPPVDPDVPTGPEDEPSGSNVNTVLIAAFLIVFLIADLLIVMYFVKK